MPWQRAYTFLQADGILLARSTSSPVLQMGGECACLWCELIERSSENSPFAFCLLPTVRNAGRYFMRKYFEEARMTKTNKANGKALQLQSPITVISHW